MADAKVSPTQLRLQNPLTPVTRKERTLLLFVSTIGIVMAKTGLVPEKISNFGIEFSTGDQDALLGLFAGVVLYFLIAFVIYAASDYVAWAAAGREAVRDWHQPDDGDSLAFQVGGGFVVLARGVLDFVFPVALAIYSAVVLLLEGPPPSGLNDPCYSAIRGSISASVSVRVPARGQGLRPRHIGRGILGKAQDRLRLPSSE